jgi:hypothetical protein
MYQCILEVPLSFPLIVKKESQKEIQRISTQIKEMSREYSADLNIRVDYNPTIKPVGISLEDILKWLKGKRVSHFTSFAFCFFYSEMIGNIIYLSFC